MLLIENNELIKEWNYEKNKDINIDLLTVGSSKIVWWKCEKGHEWEARVSARNDGNGCPFCSGRYRIKGVNDIFTLHPLWKKYWNFELNKNEGVNPYIIGNKSHVKAHWICSKCGKNFVRSVAKVRDEVLCSECSNIMGKENAYKTRLSKGNSILETYPNIAKEWNYKKNASLKPENLTSRSQKMVWWKCEKGHEWQSKISNRTLNNRNCPYCTNQKILKGYNDLAFLYPDLIKEWNYEKNDLTPEQVGAGSGKKYWWICSKCGSEWKAAPLYRIKGSGCPSCNSERKISVPEKTVLFYIKQYYKGNIISNYRDELIKNKELDIFLEDLKIGIEYDGIFYHKNKKRDIEKDKICNNVGIKIYHIVEHYEENTIKENYIYYKVNQKNNLEWAINSLLTILFSKNKYNINIKRDQIEIYNLIDYYEKEQSLSNNYPSLIEEWDYEKNGKLKPEFVSYGSSKRVWWKCKKGHEWQAVINSRIKGSGCPYCSGNKAVSGLNDLNTLHPLLMKEWNYEKNNKVDPSNLLPQSNKKVWWICSKGHEWQTTIDLRTKGSGCPYCINQKVLKGYNDLETVNPILTKEWDYNKNKKLTPDIVVEKSNKKVWWICPKGHEYEAAIGDRSRGKGCPYCANQKLLVGYNDLSSKNPTISKEWNYEKNGDLKPEQFFPNTHKKVWWICSKGHEYEAYIIDRNNGTGCPVCANKIIIKGYNDLESLKPELVKFWDYKKNKSLMPNQVSISSSKKVWWKCPKCGNVWNSRVVDTTKKKYFCSKCKKDDKEH